jgi:hypothetical protein
MVVRRLEIFCGVEAVGFAGFREVLAKGFNGAALNPNFLAEHENDCRFLGEALAEFGDGKHVRRRVEV